MASNFSLFSPTLLPRRTIPNLLANLLLLRSLGFCLAQMYLQLIYDALCFPFISNAILTICRQLLSEIQQGRKQQQNLNSR